MTTSRLKPSKPPGCGTDESQVLWTADLLCGEVTPGMGDDELKRRFWGWSLPRCLALSRCLQDARPGVAPAPFCGELALVELLALARCRSRAASATRRIACGKLEPAQLVALKRRPPEGVVLLVGEQVPEQHAELARRRDERDLGPAPGPQALIEGAQRPGVRTTIQAASQSMWRASGEPCLEI